MLLLFDIDATLIKLKNGVGRAVLRQVFTDTYRADPLEAMHGYSFSGRTDRQIVLDLARALGIHDSLANDGFPIYQLELERLMLESIDASCLDLLEGVHHTLEAAAAHHHLALVTGNIRRIAFHKLAVGGIDKFFEVGAFGCEHANRSLLPPLAVSRFNNLHGTSYAARSAVVIGDAPGDVTCATENGMATVAVATGEFSTSQLLQAGAAIALPSLADASAFLDALESLQT
jgi:phosphoglycolate phosphatase